MQFSVIIPVYNAGPYISAALASVAAQSLAPDEVIVVDDGSTDDSVARAMRAGVKVRLLESGARNAAAARNVGIRAARGKWIAFLDADDLWHPLHLERSAALLGASSAVGLLANHDWLRADGSVEPIPESMRCDLSAPVDDLTPADFARLLSNGFHFGHSTEVVARERVLARGGFDESQQRRHDIDLWFKVIDGHRWVWDSELHASYRVDAPGSLSKDATLCERFYLRALLRHEATVGGPDMARLVAVSARRAMGLAFVDGERDEFDRVRALAWPRLAPGFRLGYRLFGLAPPLFRALLRMKRALFNASA